MMVHASTMGIRTGKELQLLGAPRTGGDRREQTELLLLGAPRTGGGRSKQTELLLGGFSAPGSGGGSGELLKGVL